MTTTADTAKTAKKISGVVNRVVDDTILIVIVLALTGSWWIALGVVALWNSLCSEIRRAS